MREQLLLRQGWIASSSADKADARALQAVVDAYSQRVMPYQFCGQEGPHATLSKLQCSALMRHHAAHRLIASPANLPLRGMLVFRLTSKSLPMRCCKQGRGETKQQLTCQRASPARDCECAHCSCWHCHPCPPTPPSSLALHVAETLRGVDAPCALHPPCSPCMNMLAMLEATCKLKSDTRTQTLGEGCLLGQQLSCALPVQQAVAGGAPRAGNPSEGAWPAPAAGNQAARGTRRVSRTHQLGLHSPA